MGLCSAGTCQRCGNCRHGRAEMRSNVGAHASSRRKWLHAPAASSCATCRVSRGAEDAKRVHIVHSRRTSATPCRQHNQPPSPASSISPHSVHLRSGRMQRVGRSRPKVAAKVLAAVRHIAQAVSERGRRADYSDGVYRTYQDVFYEGGKGGNHGCTRETRVAWCNSDGETECSHRRGNAREEPFSPPET